MLQLDEFARAPYLNQTEKKKERTQGLGLSSLVGRQGPGLLIRIPTNTKNYRPGHRLITKKGLSLQTIDLVTEAAT